MDAGGELVAGQSRTQVRSIRVCGGEDLHTLKVVKICVLQEEEAADVFGEGYGGSQCVGTTRLRIEAGFERSQMLRVSTLSAEKTLKLSVGVGYYTQSIFLVGGVDYDLGTVIRGDDICAYGTTEIASVAVRVSP